MDVNPGLALTRAQLGLHGGQLSPSLGVPWPPAAFLALWSQCSQSSCPAGGGPWLTSSPSPSRVCASQPLLVACGGRSGHRAGRRPRLSGPRQPMRPPPEPSPRPQPGCRGQALILSHAPQGEEAPVEGTWVSVVPKGGALPMLDGRGWPCPLGCVAFAGARGPSRPHPECPAEWPLGLVGGPGRPRQARGTSCGLLLLRSRAGSRVPHASAGSDRISLLSSRCTTSPRTRGSTTRTSRCECRAGGGRALGRGQRELVTRWAGWGWLSRRGCGRPGGHRLGPGVAAWPLAEESGLRPWALDMGQAGHALGSPSGIPALLDTAGGRSARLGRWPARCAQDRRSPSCHTVGCGWGQDPAGLMAWCLQARVRLGPWREEAGVASGCINGTTSRAVEGLCPPTSPETYKVDSRCVWPCAWWGSRQRMGSRCRGTCAFLSGKAHGCLCGPRRSGSCSTGQL